MRNSLCAKPWRSAVGLQPVEEGPEMPSPLGEGVAGSAVGLELDEVGAQDVRKPYCA